MKRITLALASAGTALALALGSTTSSYAATGVFLYTALGGEQETLDNPLANYCFNITGDGHAVNRTNKIVLVFKRAGCVGNPQKIRPGDHAFDISFESVEFVS
ncbi:hypothetical protein ACFYWU_40540 [Streptomyces chrestomyceticus]|uniref:hypothetical protein n=1 Tax=Streptomyces chrestomyceticus TaxID=68185 RepID=UPI0036844FCE